MFYLIVNYRCWNVVKEEENWPSNKVVIHLCSAHIIKSITNRLARLTTDKDVKELCTYVFARMIDSTSRTELTKLFTNLCILLLKENFGDEQKVWFLLRIIIY